VLEEEGLEQNKDANALEIFISAFEECESYEVLSARKTHLQEKGIEGSLYEDWMYWDGAMADAMASDADPDATMRGLYRLGLIFMQNAELERSYS